MNTRSQATGNYGTSIFLGRENVAYAQENSTWDRLFKNQVLKLDIIFMFASLPTKLKSSIFRYHCSDRFRKGENIGWRLLSDNIEQASDHICALMRRPIIESVHHALIVNEQCSWNFASVNDVPLYARSARWISSNLKKHCDITSSATVFQQSGRTMTTSPKSGSVVTPA